MRYTLYEICTHLTPKATFTLYAPHHLDTRGMTDTYDACILFTPLIPSLLVLSILLPQCFTGGVSAMKNKT